MKFTLIIILFQLLLFSCTNKYFSDKNVYNCVPENNDINYHSILLPVEEGNSWEYEYEYNEEYFSKLSSKEKAKLPIKYTLSVGGETFINAKVNGKMSKVKVNLMIQNGDTSKYLYFMKCSEGTSIVEVNDGENLELAGSLLIKNEPKGDVHYWDGLTKARYEWLETIKEDSPLGSLNLYPLKEFILNKNILNPNARNITQQMLFFESSTSWYSPNVGLVKKELMLDGKVIGYLVLKDYNVSRNPSPIAP